MIGRIFTLVGRQVTLTGWEFVFTKWEFIIIKWYFFFAGREFTFTGREFTLIGREFTLIGREFTVVGWCVTLVGNGFTEGKVRFLGILGGYWVRGCWVWWRGGKEKGRKGERVTQSYTEKARRNTELMGCWEDLGFVNLILVDGKGGSFFVRFGFSVGLRGLKMRMTVTLAYYNELNFPISLINALNICPDRKALNSGLSLYSLNTSKLLSIWLIIFSLRTSVNVI